jgi:hypothetical protein
MEIITFKAGTTIIIQGIANLKDSLEQIFKETDQMKFFSSF